MFEKPQMGGLHETLKREHLTKRLGEEFVSKTANGGLHETSKRKFDKTVRQVKNLFQKTQMGGCMKHQRENI